MLKQRLLTAAILIPLVVWGVVSLSTESLGWVLAVFVMVGAWEWSRLIELTKPVSRAAYLVLVAACLCLLGYSVAVFESSLLFVLAAAGCWWLLATIMVFRYRGATGLQTGDRVLGVIIGVMVLVPTWIALAYIHSVEIQGPYLLLFLMVLIWGADSGAYFAGRKWGQHKLAPQVSPGKTIEGVLGGLLISAIVAVFGLVIFDLPVADALWFVPLCFFVVVFSVVGDLFESLFKRRVGVKDSGQLLPGHGGVLDRIDSLTAAGPIFALGLYVFGGLQ